MGKDPRHELVRDAGQPVRILPVDEQVLPLFIRQRHVDVHPAAVLPFDGLRHEGRVHPFPLGDDLRRHLEGHDFVRGGKGVDILEVDLMLGRGDLVVARLNFIAHGPHVQDDVPAHVLRAVQVLRVEVARAVPDADVRPAVLIQREEEKFALRPHVKMVAHLLGLFDRALQDESGIPFEGFPVRAAHVADHARHLALLRAPGKYFEGIGIRMQIHVRFLHPDKAFHAGTVEHAVVVQGPVQLARGNRYVLEHSVQVGELEADELHLLVLNNSQNFFSRHNSSFCSPQFPSRI